MADGVIFDDNSSVDVNVHGGISYKHSLSDNDILARGKPDDSRQRRVWENGQQIGLSQSQNEYNLRERNNSEGNDCPSRLPRRSLPGRNVYPGHRRNWSGDMAYLHYMDPGNQQYVPVLNNSNSSNDSFYSPQPSPRPSSVIRERPTTNNEFPRSESMINMNIIRHQLSTPNFPVSSSPNMSQHSVSFDGNIYPSENFVLYPHYNPPPHGFVPSGASQHQVRPYIVSPQAPQYLDRLMGTGADIRYRPEYVANVQSPEYSHQFAGRPRIGSDDYNNAEFNHHRNSLDISDYLCKQQVSFLNLQTATGEATNLKEELEKQVRELENQLNQMFAVESNPTEEEIRKLQRENEKLEHEIEQMFSELDMELDTKETPSYPEEPVGDYFPQYKPNRIYNENGEPIGVNKRPIRPINKKLPPPPPITVQPPYNELSSPLNNTYENVPSHLSRTDQNIPPPLPPHVPIVPQIAFQDDEKWKCPQCTFENLAIPKCEICDFPRPVFRRI